MNWSSRGFCFRRYSYLQQWRLHLEPDVGTGGTNQTP
jgi:hypothetical protein